MLLNLLEARRVYRNTPLPLGAVIWDESWQQIYEKLHHSLHQ